MYIYNRQYLINFNSDVMFEIPWCHMAQGVLYLNGQHENMGVIWTGCVSAQVIVI